MKIKRIPDKRLTIFELNDSQLFVFFDTKTKISTTQKNRNLVKADKKQMFIYPHIYLMYFEARVGTNRKMLEMYTTTLGVEAE